MAEMPEFFDNITIGSFVLTGVPVKVYVDGVYLTITDPDDIEDPMYGFGIDESGEVHNFDYRMVDHLLIAGQHLDLETYKKAMAPEPAAVPSKAPKEEEPAKEEPKKEESIMKLKSLIEKNIKRKSGKLNEDISADKKKLADLRKRKTLLAQDIATITKKIADQEASDASAGVTTEAITDISEPYTINVGGMVQNINPDCMHYGSMGTVDKMIALPGDVGTVVKYTVTNDGDTFSAGDVLMKTMDQLIPVDAVDLDDEEMYDDDSDEMDDWEVTNMDGLDDEEEDDDEDYGEVVDDEDEDEA
jgi:hypothetical protein